MPVGVGVGVVVPAGLCELDWPLPLPDEAWPEAAVPAPVLAQPAPEPAALAPLEFDGEVVVFEPV